MIQSKPGTGHDLHGLNAGNGRDRAECRASLPPQLAQAVERRWRRGGQIRWLRSGRLRSVVRRKASSAAAMPKRPSLVRPEPAAEERHQRSVSGAAVPGGENHFGAGMVGLAAGAGRADPKPAVRSPAPDRSSPPAMAPARRAGPAAADNACRPAPRCRCAPGRCRRRRQSRRDSADISRSLTSSPLKAASASEASLAEPTSVTSQPWAKSRISAWVYSRLTVPLVPSTETRLVFERAQAGLIAGTVPTNGTW